MKSLVVWPHAKINLGLRILRLRGDGYHDIKTRFQTIDLRDEIEVAVLPAGLELIVEGLSVPADSSNLVFRTAEALREGRRGLPGARIRLTKRIPVAAGLGGGSSDAAATMVALNHLWALDLPTEDLARIGSRLGADVPFFLWGGTALGRGRGDEIEPLPDLPRRGVCLVLSPFEVSTREAYRGWDEQAVRSPSLGESPESSRCDEAWGETADSCRNDFTTPLLVHRSELREHLDRLLRLGATAVSLSGSGPTLYGLFADERAALSAAEKSDWGEARTHACRTVAREEYRRALGVPAF